jgi:hypothetical protein
MLHEVLIKVTYDKVRARKTRDGNNGRFIASSCVTSRMTDELKSKKGE